MPQRTYSVTVILRPAKGRLSELDPVSGANLAAAMPAAETLGRAQRYFEANHCKVAAGGGNSFSIEASEEVLAKLFDKQELRKFGKTGGELNLRKLPRDVQELLEAVAFSAPPDFGPGGFV
ncbi:MAG: hypothetical protein FJW30_11710 [Acidobacteria bacterium]|nr:hypothetical protein [Acidobacteriota bacterium]